MLRRRQLLLRRCVYRFLAINLAICMFQIPASTDLLKSSALTTTLISTLPVGGTATRVSGIQLS